MPVIGELCGIQGAPDRPRRSIVLPSNKPVTTTPLRVTFIIWLTLLITHPVVLHWQKQRRDTETVVLQDSYLGHAVRRTSPWDGPSRCYLIGGIRRTTDMHILTQLVLV